MKLLSRLLALCLTILTAALLSGVYLLNSQHGLEWSYRLAATVLPGELSIEQLEGRLRGPFTLRGVHYHNADLDLNLAQLDLQWQPGALVIGKLQVDSLTLTGLHIQQPPSGGSTGTVALPDIHLPLAVQVDQATLHDLTVAERGKAKPFTLNEASLTNAGFTGGKLHLGQMTATSPAYHLELAGSLTPRQDYPMDLTLRWSADGGDFGTLRGQAQVNGDLKRLTIHHRLTAPIRADLRGTVSDALTRLSWQGDLSLPETELQTLRAQWPALALGGTLHGKGNLQRIQVEGDLHSRYQDLRGAHRFALAYDNDTLTLSRFETILPRSNARLEVHGTLTDLARQPQVVLEGAWQGLRWPLQGVSQIHSATGSFSAGGTLDHYQAHIEGDMAGEQVPAGNWSLNAEGTPQRLTITQLEGRLLDGMVTANGKLDWQPKLQWQAEIQGKGLDPGVKWPDMPGRIAFTAHSNGAIVEGITQIHVTLPQLKGELKSVPIDGDGSLNIQGDRFDLAKLRIDGGGNHFTAAGTLQDTWNLQWRVTAADLGKSNISSPPPPLPPGEGRGEGGRQRPANVGHLQGSGDIRGPRAAPMLTASLAGQQLNIADRHIDELTLTMAVDTHDRTPSTLDLEVHNASFGNLHLESLHLRGNGTAAGHQARLSVTTPSGNLDLKVNGGYEQRQWTGKVEVLDIDAPIAGRWQLTVPSAIALGGRTAHLDELCLQQGSGRLCATAQWAAEQGWQSQATARAVPLSLIKDWMPPGTSLTGNLDADAHAAADAAGLITATAQARVKAGVVPPAVPGKEQTAASIAYHQGQVTLTLDKQALTAQLQADLAGGGMQGSLHVERTALPLPLGAGRTALDTALSGRLQGDIRDLSLLPALVPGVEHTQGRLFTTLTIAGSLDNPRLMGEARLENGSAAVPALGINPETISLVARGDEQGRLRLDAQLRSKGGKLHLKGDLHYDKAQGLSIEAQLDGDKAEIVNTPEYHVLASPNLHLKLKGRRIDLDGEIFIPEANLRPRDVSGAVSPSNDVVIVSGEGPPAPESRWQIYSQLRVRLGDFVKFNGFGLNGLLAGDLTLNDAPRQPTVARGELSITNGEYRAYGQKLSVERGRLLFFGGPVDNPGLDIRAVRHIQEVTAGIMVRGTLKTPQVQIFSEPAMAETDALSYLLTGQPISQASASQGQQLYGAALTLGLAGSGLLANQIGQRFGIDEVLVESGGSFGGGALVIRHYLSPKLYISYGVGLVERFNVFLMRYQISRLWSLEANSGIQSGADLVYTLERE